MDTDEFKELDAKKRTAYSTGEITWSEYARWYTTERERIKRELLPADLSPYKRELLARLDPWITENYRPEWLGKRGADYEERCRISHRQDVINHGYTLIPYHASKTGEVAYFPDYETFKRNMAGHFQNGDQWTGERWEGDEGRTLFKAIDANGYEYETDEMPTAYPLFTMTRFDGVWTEQQVKDYIDKEKK
jgi:hypothetical protein